MSDEILECILPYIKIPKDRSSISMVCRRWYEMDRLTRSHITIALCYSTTPQRLYDRFPNIQSLKLKGKPRAAMFNLIPEDWGGYLRPWVQMFGAFIRLDSVHFRRMIVTDDDLRTIAVVKGRVLRSLKLDNCSGFSTDGLLHITKSCENLKTLYLADSSISETSGEWLHQLALNNSVLESLNFYMTFLEQIRVEDLELLARNCPLVSLKIGDIDLIHLTNFFRSATTLQEFCGGAIGEELDQYANIIFPAHLNSVGLMYLRIEQVPILYPVGHMLRKLDLVYASLDCEGHCNLLRRCPNLEVLEAVSVIGDQGLEVVSLTCKRLKRLQVENGEDEQGNGVVTQRGLIAVAHGCHELEHLSSYVSDITNEALVHVGENLNNLIDFQLILLDKEDTITDMPLDNGVRALLQRCQKMQRLTLYLRQGCLTDVGLGYVGQFSQNLRWLLIGFAGETDVGLLKLSEGCPYLQKLEIRNCRFTERALVTAAARLASLRYMWVQGYRASMTGIVDLLKMGPFWNIELIGEDQQDKNDQFEWVNCPSHFVAYCSLAGQRTDNPQTVYPLKLFLQALLE